jgi:hypothetical protein
MLPSRLKGQSPSSHLKLSPPSSSIIAIEFSLNLYESLLAPWTLEPFLRQAILQLQSRQTSTPLEVSKTSAFIQPYQAKCEVTPGKRSRH